MQLRSLVSTNNVRYESSEPIRSIAYIVDQVTSHRLSSHSPDALIHTLAKEKRCPLERIGTSQQASPNNESSNDVQQRISSSTRLQRMINLCGEIAQTNTPQILCDQQATGIGANDGKKLTKIEIFSYWFFNWLQSIQTQIRSKRADQIVIAHWKTEIGRCGETRLAKKRQRTLFAWPTRDKANLKANFKVNTLSLAWSEPMAWL